jgi:hypothetical protein
MDAHGQGRAVQVLRCQERGYLNPRVLIHLIGGSPELIPKRGTELEQQVYMTL